MQAYLLGLPADVAFVHLQKTSVGCGLRGDKEGLERRWAGTKMVRVVV